MITAFLINLVRTALAFIFSVVPHFALPSWLAAGTAFPSGVASGIGGALAAVAPYLPVDLILTVLGSVLSLWPVVIGYLIFQWVWDHVPEVAGFGTK